MGRASRGRGHWPGVLALGSLSLLLIGSTSHGTTWAASAGFAVATLLALGLFLHARAQPPCWQFERMSGRDFYCRQQHSLFGISSVYWTLPFSFASVLLAWVAATA